MWPSWLAQDVFSLLPLAARVNKEVLVLHGGLCRTGTATIEQMKAIDRRRPVPVSTNDPKDVLFFDTMWAGETFQQSVYTSLPPRPRTPPP